jgi:hypothetical protein
MKKIDKLQKFLSTHTPSVYWPPTYDGKSADISFDNTDWNQTLTTKINEVAARVYQESGIGGPETILISGQYSDMQAFFHSLLYFKADITHRKGYFILGKLAGRFDVIVIPELDADYKIFVCKVNDTKGDPFDINNYKTVGVVKIK